MDQHEEPRTTHSPLHPGMLGRVVFSAGVLGSGLLMFHEVSPLVVACVLLVGVVLAGMAFVFQR